MFFCFSYVRKGSAKNRFFSLSFGETGPPCENIDRDLISCPGRSSILILEKIVKNRDLGISKIPNIDEVDGINLASSRGLRWGKTEALDDILMFCSTNVPSIPYQLDLGIFVIHF